MGLLIPTFLPLVVPLGLGIAVLFIYYKFAVDSEIVVMRAVGISSLKLAMPALVLAVIVTFFGYLLTTWIAPAANRELVALQYRVRDNFFRGSSFALATSTILPKGSPSMSARAATTANCRTFCSRRVRK